MKRFMLLLAIGLVWSDKLDRTYLPPPGFKLAGGSPGAIDIPLEFPKETYARPLAPGQRDEGFSGDSRPVIGIDRGPGLSGLPQDLGSVIPGSKSPFTYFPKVPTTTTSYAFSQTTTFPTPEEFETTISPLGPGRHSYPADTPSFSDLQQQTGVINYPHPGQVRTGFDLPGSPINQQVGLISRPVQQQVVHSVMPGTLIDGRPVQSQFQGLNKYLPGSSGSTVSPISGNSIQPGILPQFPFNQNQGQSQHLGVQPPTQLNGQQFPSVAPGTFSSTSSQVLPQNSQPDLNNQLNGNFNNIQGPIPSSNISPQLGQSSTQFRNPAVTFPTSVSSQGLPPNYQLESQIGNNFGNVQGNMPSSMSTPTTSLPREQGQIIQGRLPDTLQSQHTFNQNLGTDRRGQQFPALARPGSQVQYQSPDSTGTQQFQKPGLTGVDGDYENLYRPSSDNRPSILSPAYSTQSTISATTSTPFPSLSTASSSAFSSTTPTYPHLPNQKSLITPVHRPERPQAESDRNAVILNYENTLTPEGYAYSYDTSNGIHADESGTAVDGVKALGSYSYTGDDGKIYNIIYSADENGFQPQGDHLPTPPPVPEAIQRVIEQAVRDKEAGISHDGFYDDTKYGHMKYQGPKNRYRPTKDRIINDDDDISEEYVGRYNGAANKLGSQRPIIEKDDASNDYDEKIDNEQYLRGDIAGTKRKDYKNRIPSRRPPNAQENDEDTPDNDKFNIAKGSRPAAGTQTKSKNKYTSSGHRPIVPGRTSNATGSSRTPFVESQREDSEEFLDETQENDSSQTSDKTRPLQSDKTSGSKYVNTAINHENMNGKPGKPKGTSRPGIFNTRYSETADNSGSQDINDFNGPSSTFKNEFPTSSSSTYLDSEDYSEDDQQRPDVTGTMQYTVRGRPKESNRPSLSSSFSKAQSGGQRPGTHYIDSEDYLEDGRQKPEVGSMQKTFNGRYDDSSRPSSQFSHAPSRQRPQTNTDSKEYSDNQGKPDLKSIQKSNRPRPISSKRPVLSSNVFSQNQSDRPQRPDEEDYSENDLQYPDEESVQQTISGKPKGSERPGASSSTFNQMQRSRPQRPKIQYTGIEDSSEDDRQKPDTVSMQQSFSEKPKGLMRPGMSTSTFSQTQSGRPQYANVQHIDEDEYSQDDQDKSDDGSVSEYSNGRPKGSKGVGGSSRTFSRAQSGRPQHPDETSSVKDDYNLDDVNTSMTISDKKDMSRPSYSQQTNAERSRYPTQQPMAPGSGYQYIPPRNKFEQDGERFKGIGQTTRRPLVQYETTNQQTTAQPFMTPNVSRNDDDDVDDDVTNKLTPARKPIKTTSVKRPSISTPKEYESNYKIDNASDHYEKEAKSNDDDRTTPSRVRPGKPGISSTRLPSYGSSQQSTTRPHYDDRFTPSSSPGDSYENMSKSPYPTTYEPTGSVDDISDKTVYPGTVSTRPGVTRIPSTRPTSRPPLYSEKAITPGPFRPAPPGKPIVAEPVTIRSGFTPPSDIFTTRTEGDYYDVATTLRPGSSSILPGHVTATDNDRTVSPGFVTIRPGMTSRYPGRPGTNQIQNIPSTTYRPNYTFTEKPGAGQVITIDEFGRPIPSDQTGQTFIGTSTYRPQLSGSQGPGTISSPQSPGIAGTINPSLGAAQFGAHHVQGYRPGQVNRPPYYGQSTTERIIGEDFSGPKQPQRFDPETGYHY